MAEPIRIAVVDDHPLFLDGVIQTFKSFDGVEIAAMGSNCDDAVKIVRDVKPDILLLDVQLPGCGIEAAKRIAAMMLPTRIIMLTASERDQDLSAALEAGVCGYVLKGVSGRELLQTIHLVLKGETYVTPALAARMLKNIHHKSAPAKAEKSVFVLTPREEDILECVAEGRTNKEIAIELNISEKTVKHYMTTIMHKLQVRNRVEAALKARQRKAQQGTTDSGGRRNFRADEYSTR